MCGGRYVDGLAGIFADVLIVHLNFAFFEGSHAQFDLGHHLLLCMGKDVLY